MVRVTRPAHGITLNAGHREYLLDENNKIMDFDNKAKAIAFLRMHGITDLTGIEFPVVRLRDSRYTLFAKKWARVYLKTDMSQWNDVAESIEIEYNARIKKDAKFRKDAESSSMTLSQEISYWVDIIGHTQFKK